MTKYVVKIPYKFRYPIVVCILILSIIAGFYLMGFTRWALTGLVIFLMAVGGLLAYSPNP